MVSDFVEGDKLSPNRFVYSPIGTSSEFKKRFFFFFFFVIILYVFILRNFSPFKLSIDEDKSIFNYNQIIASDETAYLQQNNSKHTDENFQINKSILPSLTVGKKWLRHGGVKLYIYNSITEKEIKHHPVKFLFLLFNKNENKKEEIETTSDESTVGNKELYEALSYVANKNVKNEIVHVYVEDKYVTEFSFLFSDDYEKDLPFAFIVDVNNGWKKYKYKQDDNLINKFKLEQFEEDFFEGKLKPYFRSAPILVRLNAGNKKNKALDGEKDALYEKNEAINGKNEAKNVKNSEKIEYFEDDDETQEDVEQIVSLQFHDKVMKAHYDVIVFFYAPWCGHSKNLEPILSELARKFRKIKSVRFFKIDITKNDIDHDKLIIGTVPHLRFFKYGDKENPIQIDHIKMMQDADYAKNFILSHATCKNIDLFNQKDCNDIIFEL